MDRLTKLTVHELLSHPSFKEAQLVAGTLGVNRHVRWIHVLEITEVGHLLNGNEVILSTGVGWSQSPESIASFLHQLIQKQVSALCIELGTYIKEIPDLMKEIANDFNFPLIAFPREVRFIDLTQSINTMVMETQFKMMSDLEAYSNQLNHLLLSSGAFKAILRLLHHYLNVQVIYKPLQGELICAPHLQDQQLAKMITHHDVSELKKLLKDQRNILHQPIEALGQTYADLIIMSQNQEWTEYDVLVLDRTATALSQDQLRSLYVEQQRRNQENQWVGDWLDGKFAEEEVEAYLTDLTTATTKNGCVVCICKFSEPYYDIDMTYYSMVFTGMFEKLGFFSLNTHERNTSVFILFDQRKSKDWKKRCESAFTHIQSLPFFRDKQCGIRFAIGRPSYNLEAKKSYAKARETLQFQEKGRMPAILFYEDLSIYRLLSKMDPHELKEFVEDYIGDLLENDVQTKEPLFETLKVLLEVNGSKKEAAERLHVVRQTLYHRVARLSAFVGDPFETPEKRLAIELAVHAWEYLQG